MASELVNLKFSFFKVEFGVKPWLRENGTRTAFYFLFRNYVIRLRGIFVLNSIEHALVLYIHLFHDFMKSCCELIPGVAGVNSIVTLPCQQQ